MLSLGLRLGGGRFVKIDPSLHFVSALSQSPFIGVSQGKNTTTIFLLVKAFPLGNINHTLGASGLSPIIGPISKILITTRRSFTAAIDLGHIFPPGNP